MAVISSIQLQRRDSSQCNIYIDQRFVCAIPALDVSAMGLRTGLEVNEALLQELTVLAQGSKCYRVALRYLGLRMHSVFETRQYLARKAFEPDDISITLDRLISSGLLNDLEFAQLWVKDRMNLRPRSQRQLEQELLAKGVDRDVIAQVFQGMAPEDEVAALARLVAKKRRTGYSDDKKLTQYLMRQGYRYDLISSALAGDNNQTG